VGQQWSGDTAGLGCWSGVGAGPAVLGKGTKVGPLLASEAFERGYHLGGGEVKSELRKLPFLYRFRGVGEGVFGGLKTRLNGLPKLAIKRVLLEAICYDLRILPGSA